MTELRIGVVTFKDLAEWFGITRIVSSQREKKLEELKNFCEYEITESGKVNIIRIIEPRYVKRKDRIQAAATEYLQYFNPIDKCKYLGTATRTAIQLIKKYQFNVSVDYVARAVGKILHEEYGYAKDKSRGTKGYSSYTWCKCSTSKLDPRCELLTPKEKKDISEIVDKIFTSNEFMDAAGRITEAETLQDLQELKDDMQSKYLELYERTLEYFNHKYYFIPRGTLLEDAEAS